MDFLDGMRLLTAVDDVKVKLANIQGEVLVGDVGEFPIPGAKKLAALLVKGKKGRRVRITGITYEVEA